MQSGTEEILAKLYFHSEQAIWICVKEKIVTYKKNLIVKSGTLESYFKSVDEQEEKNSISHIFLDICSCNDMCWGCADVGASYCHTKGFEHKVYIRASGCKKYADCCLTAEGKYNYSKSSLRDNRFEFKEYALSKQYTLEGPYKPYILHSTSGDWK